MQMNVRIVFHAGVATIGFIALSGCKLGPEYQRPVTPEPEQFLGATHASVTSVSTNLTQLRNWWQTLNDPLLAELVACGLTNNLSIQNGIQKIRQSRAQLAQANAGLWPTLTGTSSFNYGKKFGDAAGVGYSATGAGIAGEWGGTFSGGFDAAWEMDIFGGYRREIEARESEYEGMHYTQHDLEISLASEIALHYLNIRMLQEVIDVTQSNLTTQSHSADITRKRHKAKMVSGLDLANAEGQVQTTTAQLPTLHAALAESILTLENLLSEQPNTRRQRLLSTTNFPALPADLPTTIPNELLRRRPDIRQAEAVLKAATARVGVEKAELYPRLSLVGALGASVPYSPNTWGDFTESLRLGPRLTWNILNAGRVKARIEERKALVEQALLAYQKTVLNAYKEAENTWQNYNEEVKRAAPLQQAVCSSQRAVRIAQELYKAGYSDYTEVLIAERALLAAQDLEVRHRTLRAQKLIAFYKALGGGIAY